MSEEYKLNGKHWKNRIVGYDNVAPDQLLANPANFRLHPKRQQDALSGSLSELGWLQDIIVNKVTGHVLDGHLRVSLSLRNGEATVPVKYVDLSESEERLALATFDPITYMAETDAAALDALLRQVNTGEESLQALLAEMADNAGLDYGKAAVVEDVEPQIDRAEELRAKWNVEAGQMWQLGDHRLICGDCTDAAVVERVMGGGKAELCVTSPPYNAGDSEKLTNNTHTSETKYVAGGSDNLLHDDYLFLLNAFMSHALLVSDLVVVNLQMLSGNKVALIEFLHEFKLKFADVAVWVKDTPQPAMARRVMTSAFEYLWFFSANDRPTRAIGTNDFRGTVPNVYSAPSQRENKFFQVHAATYPVHLPNWILGTFGVSGEVVYEPFSGSGTTLIACEQLGRRCRAVEISPGYVAVALERWATATGKTPVLL